MFNNIKILTDSLASDPFNPEINALIGAEYEQLGQTATAVSFYLRAAEYGHKSHPELTYNCLLKIGMCLDSQGNRNWNVSNSFLQAIQYIPDRPEAYFLMSRFFESQAQWTECYTFAELGMMFSNGVYGKLPMHVGYSGNVNLIFQKAISAWWIGRQEESKQLLLELGKVRNIEEPFRTAILTNYKALGISQDKIAIVLPVRDGGTGRSQRLLRCLNTWAKMTEGLSDVHVILDEDDVNNFGYLFERRNRIEIHVRPAGLSLMEKINSVAVDVSYMYKYVCFIGDDIEFKTPWESRFIDHLKSVPAGLVYANTLDLPDHIDWGTHPCVTSNLIQALGFFGCPAVEHNFFDNFWDDICKEFDAVKYIPDIIMDHRRVGWTPDALYHKVTGLLESDRHKYNKYKRENFASDLEKVRSLFNAE